jgi:DNA-binding NarL/FixJ family response regulator
MRLLICEDHRLLLDALSMALMENGYTVVATAINPDKAVAAAREHQPDACLLDVNFPHANGDHTKAYLMTNSYDLLNDKLARS